MANNIAQLRKSQRVMAIRASRAYRTVPLEKASLFSESTLWDLELRAHAFLYHRCVETLEQEERLAPQESKALRLQFHHVLVMEGWCRRLEQASFDMATVEAIRLILAERLTRWHGTLSFRLTQGLSGHGCFRSLERVELRRLILRGGVAR